MDILCCILRSIFNICILFNILKVNIFCEHEGIAKLDSEREVHDIIYISNFICKMAFTPLILSSFSFMNILLWQHNVVK